jgi:general secretion pathway protein H
LELLVVLAIIALVAAIALPRLQMVGAGSDAMAAARDVANAMAEGRQQAIFGNRDVRVRIDVSAGAVTVGNGTAYRLPAPLEFDLETIERETDGTAIGGIRFFPDGSATGGTLVITDRLARRARLRVNWLTGRITVDG